MDRTEALELRANRMDLVSRWADDLAHEIKNPLHAMVINLELVKRRAGGGEAEPIIQRAQIVESELNRVHALVESLLRLVRPWAPREIADVDQVFEDLLPVLGARTRVRRVDFEHRPGGGVVGIDPSHLALVLLNLFDNAIDAVAEGGHLTTETRPMREGVRVTVTDDGAGLPAALADRLPEPGLTGRPGRAGLGLAVSARLVRDAGGTLTIGSRPDGSGTTVSVTLPAAASP